MASNFMAVSEDESVAEPSVTCSRKKLRTDGAVSWGLAGAKTSNVATIMR